MTNSIWERVKPTGMLQGLTLCVYLLFRFFFLVGYVPTNSMEPTLPKATSSWGCGSSMNRKSGTSSCLKKTVSC